MKYSLKCLSCHKTYSSRYKSQICGRCSGILDVVYANGGHLFGRYATGMTRLKRSHEFDNLFFKYETDNPTRSFKDRGSVLEIEKAVEYGYKKITCGSTGNMAYSLTYFAKKAHIDATVFISDDANKEKIKEIRELHEAEVVHAHGDFTKAQKLAKEYAAKNNAFLTGDYCYRKEGQKSVVYEIVDRIEPTHIIVPVGNATFLSGICEALNQLKKSKKISKLPRVIAVQSSGCSPFVDAFLHSEKIEYQRPHTKADAIAVGYPTFGEQAMRWLRSTNGIAIKVKDSDMVAEQKRFDKEYGELVELASISTVVAYKKLKFRKDDRVVALITGGNV